MVTAVLLLLVATTIRRHKLNHQGPTVDVQTLYRDLHKSPYFEACRDKIAECKRTKPLGDTVCVDHSPSAHHPDRLSRDHPPDRIVWDRNCDPESCGLVFIGAENARESKYWHGNYCKVLFGLESPDLFPTKQTMQEFSDRADIILTYTDRMEFSRPEKVFPFFGASTWIQPESVRVHEKSRSISIIASGKNQLKGHKLRHSLIQQYQHRLDVFGLGYNPVELKETALAPYMYSVVIENSQDHLFFSEKIIDAFLTGTIPIYWGGAGVPELFNKRGIKLFEDERKDFASVLEECTDKYYMDNIDAVRENFNIALQFVSPERVLEEHLLKQLGFGKSDR